MDLSFGSWLLVLSITLFILLLNTNIFWVITKLLKFKETSFKKAIKVIGTLWLIMIVIGAEAFGLFTPAVGLIIELILPFIFIASPVIIAFLIKRIFNETWTKTIIATLITLILCGAIYVFILWYITPPSVCVIPPLHWILADFSNRLEG